SSDRMNAIVAAISSGRADRPTRLRCAVRARSRSVSSGVAEVPHSLGVSTGPGQTQLTGIPSWAWSIAIALVSPTTPAFDAQYAGLARQPTRPNCDEMVTVAPPPAAPRRGTAARASG